MCWLCFDGRPPLACDSHPEAGAGELISFSWRATSSFARAPVARRRISALPAAGGGGANNKLSNASRWQNRRPGVFQTQTLAQPGRCAKLGARGAKVTGVRGRVLPRRKQLASSTNLVATCRFLRNTIANWIKAAFASFAQRQHLAQWRRRRRCVGGERGAMSASRPYRTLGRALGHAPPIDRQTDLILLTPRPSRLASLGLAFSSPGTLRQKRKRRICALQAWRSFGALALKARVGAWRRPWRPK